MSRRLIDRRWPWWAAAAGIVLYFLSTFLEIRIGEPDDDRPFGSADDIVKLRERDDVNLLFVLIDTLRADRLGSYGYARETSPRIDAIAKNGVRLARHLAQSSWTKCSMASLWTGLYPAHIGVTRFDDVLPEEALMPAEVLSAAGFRTAGIYRNGWVSNTFGFAQGFEVYMRPSTRPPAASVRVENPTVSGRGTDYDVVDAATEFLRVGGRERWFLYLHLMDVHEYLYSEESALFGGSYSDVYDNSIRWVDTVVGDLLTHLAAEGHAKNTLVVITADHGEAFRERGFEGHARQVYRETTEVPLILSFPFRLAPGIVVEARTRNVDIWPTLFDLLGLEPPDAADGRSLVPEILAGARGDEPLASDATGLAHLDRHWGQRSREPRPTVSVADDRFRYVRIEGQGPPLELLFDASRDPAELENRIEKDPAEANRLRAIAESYLASRPLWGEAPTREIDELELNQLRALGYAIP